MNTNKENEDIVEDLMRDVESYIADSSNREWFAKRLGSALLSKDKQIQEAVGSERKRIHTYLVSEEARIAKEGLSSDFENGYFEAIDDIAKWLSNNK